MAAHLARHKNTAHGKKPGKKAAKKKTRKSKGKRGVGRPKGKLSAAGLRSSMRAHLSDLTRRRAALDSEIADDRRTGVLGLAESRDGHSEWAVKVYDTIARTDTDAMVRCAALKSLALSPSADRVPTALKILNSQRKQYEDVRRAPARVRWSASRLLARIVFDYAVEESQYELIKDTLRDMAVNAHAPDITEFLRII